MADETLTPRITGTEMEYSILKYATDSNRPPFDKKAYLSLVNKSLGEDVPHVEQFYANGSRIYGDIGEHVEYATPEDPSFAGTCANEIAGEEIVTGPLKMFDDPKWAPQINKRVVDRRGTTWGYHESYCADATTVEISMDRLELLGIHLATRNVFVGAGCLRTVPSKHTIFTVSQKNFRLQSEYANSTGGAGKPVVNLRQEHHANTSDWVRVHVTSGDANMSPRATIMKLGTTSLVLRLIEHGIQVPDIHLPSLTDTSDSVARDTTLLQPVTVLTNDGEQRTMRPFEIQTELCVAARSLSKDVQLPEEEEYVLQEWEQDCADAACDPRLLTDRVEWMSKLALLEHFTQKQRIDFTSNRARGRDEQWDSLGKDGIGLKLRERIPTWAAWMPDPQLIAERKLHAPSSSRAADREAFIRACSGKKVAGVDWARCGVIINGSGKAILELPDPYMVNAPGLPHIIKRTLAWS